jgi:hypothetical protein
LKLPALRRDFRGIRCVAGSEAASYDAKWRSGQQGGLVAARAITSAATEEVLRFWVIFCHMFQPAGHRGDIGIMPDRRSFLSL